MCVLHDGSCAVFLCLDFAGLRIPEPSSIGFLKGRIMNTGSPNQLLPSCNSATATQAVLC